MRIQELEQLVNADRATIRYYEKEGLIVPNRSENGYRDYTEDNAQELKRILLLRQLGVSIHTIRKLQQGSMDFSDVMADQIQALSQQIGAKKRAKALCEVMHQDGVTYHGMDTDHYARMLDEITVDAPQTGFRENLPRECHPWSRFFARWLDCSLLSSILYLIIVVILRIRPTPGTFANALLTVCAGFLLAPLEAWMLSKWGTTPGKYALGIHVSSVNGGNLTWTEAWQREWSVLRDGACFYIPFLSIWSFLRCYFRLTGRSSRRFVRKEDIPDPEEMNWDENCEIQYRYRDRRRGAVLAGILAAILVMGVLIGVDGVKPRYRGNEITVAQFASNYNHTLSILSSGADSYEKMQQDGTRMVMPDAITGDGTPIYNNAYQPKNFDYTTENGILQSITMEKQIKDAMYVVPMSSDTVIATFAVLLGQKDVRVWDLTAISEELAELANLEQGTIAIGDHVVITWQIEFENYVCENGTYYRKDKDSGSWLHYSYTITIQ